MSETVAPSTQRSGFYLLDKASRERKSLLTPQYPFPPRFPSHHNSYASSLKRPLFLSPESEV